MFELTPGVRGERGALDQLSGSDRSDVSQKTLSSTGQCITTDEGSIVTPEDGIGSAIEPVE